MTKFSAGDKVLVYPRYAGGSGVDGTYSIESDEWPFEDTLDYRADTWGDSDENGDEWVLESGWSVTEEMLEPANVVSDDVVNHPSHYTKFGVEVIDLTEHLSFCAGNAVKYVARAGLKDPSKHVEDLKKAAWYIDREIARIERAEKTEAE